MSQGRPEKIWFSRGEAMQQLGVSSPTFAKFLEDGLIGALDLPGVKGRKYSARDVEALVRKGTTPARAGRLLVEA